MIDPKDSARSCRECGYSLQGLRAHRCPECGTAFDPADPGSYRTAPSISPATLWLCGLNLVLCAGLAAAVSIMLVVREVALFLGAIVCIGWSMLPYLLMAYLAYRSRHGVGPGAICLVGIMAAGLVHVLLIHNALRGRPDPIAVAVAAVYLMVGVVVLMAAVLVYEWWQRRHT